MPSLALRVWMTNRAAALDRIEAAHRNLRRGRVEVRPSTQELTHAYAVLLLSKFQGFCRSLHDECVDCIVSAVTPAKLRTAISEVFVLNRKLDAGNPNPGNLGSDFNRFGFVFWDSVRRRDARNRARQDHLDDLNRWRNAITHENFDATALGSGNLGLRQVRQWRKACHQLAVAFDEVMRAYLQSALGTSPW